MKCSFRGLLLGGALLLTSWSSALAQTSDEVLARGIDPVVNKLSPSIGSYWTLSGARSPAARSFQLDAWLDYHQGLLAFQLGNDKLGDLIQHRLDAHLMGAVAIVDGLELALDLPFTLWQAHGFDELEAETGFSAPTPTSAGLGDVRLLARLGLLRDPEGPLLVAALLEARGLTGDGDSFLGERQVLLSPRVALERDLTQRLALSLELGYRYRSQPGQYLNLYVGDEWTAGLGARYLLPLSTLARHELLGDLNVATPSRAPFTFDSAEALKTPIEALFGLRSQLSEQVQLAVGLGRGLALTPGYGRSALRVFASLRYEAEWSETAFEPEPDRDGDGVLDSVDQCPDDPGPAELDGCPDRDSDGIPDIQDQCPDDKGPPKLEGCPTDEPLVVFEDGGLTLFGTISFDSGKATIKQESFEVVDTVARLLKEHPEIQRIRVDGHTDSVGRDSANLELSGRRAQSVVTYLVGKGIEVRRLESKGFGEEKPIDTNETALGRAKNRRVEFTVLETEE